MRIIKPLEGSLTLHQWQRLAKPSLEGIFEERKGVVMRGSRVNNLTITEEDQISGKFSFFIVSFGVQCTVGTVTMYKVIRNSLPPSTN